MNSVKVHSFSNITTQKLSRICHIYNDNFPTSQWSESHFYSYFKSDLPIGYFLMAHGKIVGFIWGKKKEGENSFNLATLWVDSAHRGNGFASLLIQNFLEAAFRVSNKIYLHFRDSNDLKHFYSRFGFANHIIDGYYKNGEPKHYMEIVK